MKYENQTHKTTAAKRLVKAQNNFVREAEWQLDANAYLQEQQQWAHGSLHCKYLYQQMFLHVTATGQSEHEHTIHWGQREASLR